MSVVVKIACKGSRVVDIDELTEFQGNLKSLSEGDYKKLKNEITVRGFSFPTIVWASNGRNHIIDGHQRLRVLKRLREDGWEVPPIPVVDVEADSLKEAKRKLLAAASQYGRIDAQGLYEFMHEVDLSFIDLADTVRFAEIDMDQFEREYGELLALESKKVDADGIDSYQAETDTFSVRIDGVSQDNKEKLVRIINDELSKLQMPYEAKVY